MRETSCSSSLTNDWEEREREGERERFTTTNNTNKECIDQRQGLPSSCIHAACVLSNFLTNLCTSS